MSNEIVYGGNTMVIRPALEGGVKMSDKYLSSELNLCTLKDDPLQLFATTVTFFTLYDGSYSVQGWN